MHRTVNPQDVGSIPTSTVCRCNSIGRVADL